MSFAWFQFLHVRLHSFLFFLRGGGHLGYLFTLSVRNKVCDASMPYPSCSETSHKDMALLHTLTCCRICKQNLPQ